MEKQLQSVQIDQTKVSQENDNDLRLQEQMSRLQSIPKRKEEFSRLKKSIRYFNLKLKILGNFQIKSIVN